MRKEFSNILRTELCTLAIETRNKLNLTQKEMAIRLQMSESSYSDIETGKSACGTLTAILLLNMQEDPNTFLKSTDEKFNSWCEKEMQPV